MGKQAQTLRATIHQDHPLRNSRIESQNADGMDPHAIVGMNQVADSENRHSA
jgi:hypothetical protein